MSIQFLNDCVLNNFNAKKENLSNRKNYDYQIINEYEMKNEMTNLLKISANYNT